MLVDILFILSLLLRNSGAALDAVLRHSLGDRHRRPGSSRRRNPLIVIERKSAIDTLRPSALRVIRSRCYACKPEFRSWSVRLVYTRLPLVEFLPVDFPSPPVYSEVGPS